MFELLTHERLQTLLKLQLGILLALVIGTACRFAEIPLPAPPAFIGSFLVLSMTLGFIITDEIKTRLDRKTSLKEQAS